MAITQALIDKTETNLNRWDDIVNEDENGTTTLDNAVVKSLAGYLAEFKSYNILGAWQTGYSYSIKDVAKESGNHYICLEAHTSGTFSTDLSSGKWGLFQVDFTNLTATGTFTGTFTGDLTGDVTGDLTGSVLQASQTNITSVGTLLSLTVSGDVTVDSSVFKVDSTNNRVGIGLSSPSHRLDVDDSSLNSGNVGTVARIKATGTSSTAVTVLNVQDSLHVDGAGNVGIGTSSPSSLMHIAKSDGSAIMKVTSAGSFFLNTTSDPAGITTGYGFNISGSSQLANAVSGATVAYWNRTDSSGGTVHDFRLNGVSRGYISVSSSGTTYGTGSDYRLKENLSPIIDGISRIMKLNPLRFNFLGDKNTTVDGFLAHQVQEVIPEAVTGLKDGVDAEGKPEYQAIDQSKIVPLLVASVQELKKELNALKK